MATKTRTPARKAAAKTAASPAAAAAKPAATKTARAAKTAPGAAPKPARPQPKGIDTLLAGAVRDSAQQIWLAGMGAWAKAQDEGNRVFEALVKEGTALQRKTQAAAEEKIGEVTGRMTSMAGTVTARAGQNWDKLESIFEQRTAKAMSRLGVPTAKDVQALAERVDALAAAVERLSRARAAAPATDEPTAPATPAATRPRGRRAAPKPAEAAAAAQLPAKAAPASEAPAAPAKKGRTRRAPAAPKTPPAEPAGGAEPAPEAAAATAPAATGADAPPARRRSTRRTAP